MIKPELYHKTVGILFDAYFNDTLEHGDCYACAVGNLVSASCGYKVRKLNYGIEWPGIPYPAYQGWGRVFLTDSMGHLQHIDTSNYNGLAKEQIDATGYTWKELAGIEYAFETCKYSKNIDERMFNGLCAVLDYLTIIHEVTDQDLLTSNNNRFKEQYERRAAVQR